MVLNSITAALISKAINLCALFWPGLRAPGQCRPAPWGFPKATRCSQCVYIAQAAWEKPGQLWQRDSALSYSGDRHLCRAQFSRSKRSLGASQQALTAQFLILPSPFVQNSLLWCWLTCKVAMGLLCYFLGLHCATQCFLVGCTENTNNTHNMPFASTVQLVSYQDQRQ